VIASNIDSLELIEIWNDVDSAMRARFQFPLHGGVGTDSTAVVYFEVEPGEYLGTHTDSAEEVLFVLDGEGIAVVGDEDEEIGPGSLAVVPALAPHGVRATGDRTLRVVGFFSGAELEHVFDEPIQPIGLARVTTPPAEVPV